MFSVTECEQRGNFRASYMLKMAVSTLAPVPERLKEVETVPYPNPNLEHVLWAAACEKNELLLCLCHSIWASIQ